jgi:hypothetical protein
MTDHNWRNLFYGADGAVVLAGSMSLDDATKHASANPWATVAIVREDEAGRVSVAAPDVRELVERCSERLTMSKFLNREDLLLRALDDRRQAATALTTLSAKCAEQAAEIERLTKSRDFAVKSAEAFGADNARLRQRGAVLVAAPEETRSDLFYQISSHHSPKVAAGYPSIAQADAALSATRDGQQTEAGHV